MLKRQGRAAWDSLIVEKRGSGPTLLCLHGVGGCGNWFRGLAHRIQDRFRVLSLDLPGTGVNREEDAPFSIERCADILGDLLKQESEPVSILGHSMGTMIGLRLAAAIPSRVHSLVCVGGLPSVTPATHRRLTERKIIIQAEGMAGLGWKVAEGNFSRASLIDRPEILALFTGLWESQSPEAYVEGITALLAESEANPPQQAKLPCLVLRGVEDGYAPAEESRRFAASLPGPVRYVELEDCAHMPFLESPAEFARAVTDFLDAYAVNPA